MGTEVSARRRQIAAESISVAWDLVRRFRNTLVKAATRIGDVNPETEADSRVAVARGPLSRLEQLPEEIQVHIMNCLDDESLYRLSQTTAHFLRLSFDPTFEADPSWRAFRHTVDGLGEGPRQRVLDGASLGRSDAIATKSREQPSPSSSSLPPPPHPWAQSTTESISEWEGSPEAGDTVALTGSDDEGETMHSFMAKQYRK